MLLGFAANDTWTKKLKYGEEILDTLDLAPTACEDNKTLPIGTDFAFDINFEGNEITVSASFICIYSLVRVQLLVVTTFVVSLPCLQLFWGHGECDISDLPTYFFSQLH